MLRAPLNLPIGLSTYSARDEFNQTAGALTGKAAPVGGTWAVLTGSDTGDLTVGSGVITRADAGDTGTIAGSTLRGRAVGLDLNLAATGAAMNYQNAGDAIARSGFLLRVVDASNFLAVLANDSTAGGIGVYKVIAGTLSTIAYFPAPLITQSTPGPTMRLQAAVIGTTITAWCGEGSAPTFRGTCSDSALASTLASGDVYIYDEHIGGTPAFTRTYGAFAAWVPTDDAVIYASRSAELNTKAITRLDSGGSAYGPVSFINGDLPRMPNQSSAGTVEFMCKASRGDLATTPDPAADDISVRVYRRASYLTVG